ncbi:MAG TPA: rhomboid family intramembrane serine protease [Bdellovibrionota bacterium]|nr:rhomboid family intramembrane serine protease [Bdellovibrionota bacterium]
MSSFGEVPQEITEATLDRRKTFERGMCLAPPAILSLSAVLVLMFVVQLIGGFGWLELKGQGFDPDLFIRMGALHRESVFRGEWWRLSSSMLLHGNPGHLVGNLIALYVLGVAVEHAYGWQWTLILFTAAGIGGSLASLGSALPTVGASGAIFGLLAGAIVFFRVHERRIVKPDKRIAFILGAWAIYSLATGWLSPEIANLAHFGGFIAGGLSAYFMPNRIFSAPKGDVASDARFLFWISLAVLGLGCAHILQSALLK